MDSVKFKARLYFCPPVSARRRAPHALHDVGNQASGLQCDCCSGVKQTSTQKWHIWSDKITSPNPTSVFFNMFPCISYVCSSVRSCCALRDFRADILRRFDVFQSRNNNIVMTSVSLHFHVP